MYESGCYAPGTEFDPRAPWNEKEPIFENTSAIVSTTLSKNVILVTEENDTDPNLLQSFQESYYSVTEILDSLVKIVNDINRDGLTDLNLRLLNSLARDSEGWQEDEIEVVKE